jgi:K+-sensing histidine kinase KdpD
MSPTENCWRVFPNQLCVCLLLFGEAGFLIVVSRPNQLTLSILRYRLWDIDFFIRRTLIYSAVTATLAVIYFVIVYLFSDLFGEMIGTSSQIVRVIATLLIAILFNPLRQRIQRDIDRLFYRQRYNSEQVLAAFGERLGSEVDLDEIRADLLNVVAEVLQPQSVSLWLVKQPAQSEVQADQEAQADEILI